MRQAEVFAGRIQRASGSGTDQSSVAAGWALPALADPHSLSWTAGVGESSEARRALPEVGSRGQAVIDQLQATVTELDVCEHGCGDFRLLDRHQSPTELPTATFAQRRDAAPGACGPAIYPG